MENQRDIIHVPWKAKAISEITSIPGILGKYLGFWKYCAPAVNFVFKVIQSVCALIQLFLWCLSGMWYVWFYVTCFGEFAFLSGSLLHASFQGEKMAQRRMSIRRRNAQFAWVCFTGGAYEGRSLSVWRYMLPICVMKGRFGDQKKAFVLVGQKRLHAAKQDLDYR